MKDKTGRPERQPLDIRIYHDLEKGADVIAPGGVTYIYTTELRVTEVTVNTTLTNQTVILVDNDENISITLPTASSHTHKVYHIKKISNSAGVVEIKGAAQDETIDGEEAVELKLRYQFVSIVCDGSDWYIIGGMDMKMEELLEQQLDLLEEIRDKAKEAVTHLSLGSDEELEGD